MMNMVQKAFIANLIFFIALTQSTEGEIRGIFPIPPGIRDVQGNSIINNPTAPYVINKPGTYKFISDFATDPIISTTLLDIQSDNVRINLNGRSLYLKNPYNTKNITGINIHANCSNITIENGSINNIKGSAITVGENAFNITLQHLIITQAHGGGIEFKDYANTAFIHNCLIGKSLSVNKNNIGITLNNNANIIFSNCSILGLQAADTYNAYGIFARNCINCTFTKCAINGLSGNNTIGFALNRCDDCILENNETNGNTGTNGSSSGLYLVNSNGNTISQHVSLNNRGLNDGQGLRILGSSKFNKFDHCICSHNGSTGTGNGYGIYVSTGTSNQFSYIDAFANQGGSSINSEGAGMKIRDTEGITIRESRFHYNNGEAGTGYGILIENGTQCIIENNKMYYNRGTTHSYGIHEIGTPSSYIGANTCFGNKINFSLQQNEINSVQVVQFNAPRSIQNTSRGNVDIRTN